MEPMLNVQGAEKPVPHSEERMLFVRFCESSNLHIQLCYQTFGDPSNEAVVLIGGLNMQLYAWDEAFCELLAREGFYVIRFDNRDIGYSTKIENRGSVIGARLLLPKMLAFGEDLPYTINDMALDVLGMLNALSIQSAHVMGISMGGMIAQSYALLVPDRVRSLTSIMSTTNAADLPHPQLWVKLWMLRKPPAKCTPDELVEFRVNSTRRLLENSLAVDKEYMVRRFRVSLERSDYSNGLVRQAAAIRRCAGRDHLLGSLRCPVLVIHGAEDVIMPVAHGYRTASVVPHSKFVLVKNMGHYLHPSFFSTIVGEFKNVSSQPPIEPIYRSPAPAPPVLQTANYSQQQMRKLQDEVAPLQNDQHGMKLPLPDPCMPSANARSVSPENVSKSVLNVAPLDGASSTEASTVSQVPVDVQPTSSTSKLMNAFSRTFNAFSPTSKDVRSFLSNMNPLSSGGASTSATAAGDDPAAESKGNKGSNSGDAAGGTSLYRRMVTIYIGGEGERKTVDNAQLPPQASSTAVNELDIPPVEIEAVLASSVTNGVIDESRGVSPVEIYM